MDGETSWVMNNAGQDGTELKSFSEISNEGDKNSIVSLDFILPDDLLERILGYLPIVSIVRAGSVCKRWKEVVKSCRFLWNSSCLVQKPWYFMFTGGVDPGGYVYDPIFRKWYGFVLPCIENSDWFIASSGGLVCFMDCYSRRVIYACNPITRDSKMIEEPPGLKSPDYSALAVSVDRKLHGYSIAVAKSKQVPGDFLRWDLSIHIYDSGTKLWTTPISEVLSGWRGGDECVICDGTLYCLIYSTGVVSGSENRHGLIMYDLSTRSQSHVSLIATSIPVPCSLTCGRLMNLNDKLVMVGGIGKQDRPDIIKGIGIWELRKMGWQEVSRMPHKYFQGFGEFDDVFASSGTDNLIYIQSYGAPALLIFDMNQKQWKWSQKCPVAKRFPLQLFTGFCFEPRLEVGP